MSCHVANGYPGASPSRPPRCTAWQCLLGVRHLLSVPPCRVPHHPTSRANVGTSKRMARSSARVSTPKAEAIAGGPILPFGCI